MNNLRRLIQSAYATLCRGFNSVKLLKRKNRVGETKVKRYKIDFHSLSLSRF